MASAKLTRTFTAGNRKTYTISLWLKRSGIGSSPNYQAVFIASGGDDGIFFKNDGTLDCFFHSVEKRTNRQFRDTSGWYHIMVAVDTTQASASNRLKIYVNGEQETSFAYNSGDPAQDSQNLFNNSGGTNVIGNHSSSSYNFDGQMAHVHYVDGTAYTPTTFGETDSTTGIWKPKTAPSVTYGTNGFFLKFDNSANMGLDSAGSNNLTTTGTIIQTKDTPSNVFATLNPLDNFFGTTTLSNINNTQNQSSSSGNYSFIPSTLGFSSGKWYWEMKCVSNSSNSDMWYGTGITSNSSGGDNHYLGSFTNVYGVYGYAYATGKAATYTGGSRTDQGTSFATGDIIGVAVDCDNLAMYVHKNGVYMPDASNVTGVPTSGASRTGALFDITAPSSTKRGFYFPALCYYDVRAIVQSINFGNGYFGTTAVSSAQSPDDGNGIFEYDVPAGYRALCTKSINAEEYS